MFWRAGGGAGGRFFGQDHAASDQQNSHPAGEGNVVMQEEMAEQRHQHISAGGDWQHEAQIGTAEQSQVRQHPDDEDANSKGSPGIGEGAQVVERGSGDYPAHFVHPPAQENVAKDVSDNDQKNEDLGLATAAAVFYLHLGCWLNGSFHGAGTMSLAETSLERFRRQHRPVAGDSDRFSDKADTFT